MVRTPQERMSRRARHGREHGGKIVHTTPESAQKHAEEVSSLRPDEAPREVYECRWSDDFTLGQNAMVHWHVGRAPFSGQDFRSQESSTILTGITNPTPQEGPNADQPQRL